MNEQTPKQAVEDGAAEGLKKLQPKLYDLISTGIKRDKLTPKHVDRYIATRFGFRKGHPVRDMCFLAAMSIYRNKNAEVTK